MNKSVRDQMKQLVEISQSLYYRLILLIGQNGSEITSILHEIADDLSVEVINVNLVLSTYLIDLNRKDRVLQVSELFQEISDSCHSTVVLSNLEILFDRALKQDPLRLLQGISRNQTVIAHWSGKLEGNKIIYAEPGYPEYRSYDSTDILVVKTDSR